MYCLPSCDLANGGCAEKETCSLVEPEESQCPADVPCLPVVQCTPTGTYILYLHIVESP